MSIFSSSGVDISKIIHGKFLSGWHAPSCMATLLLYSLYYWKMDGLPMHIVSASVCGWDSTW